MSQLVLKHPDLKHEDLKFNTVEVHAGEPRDMLRHPSDPRRQDRECRRRPVRAHLSDVHILF